jgi:hypothetical protein
MASLGFHSLATAFGQLLAPISDTLDDDVAMGQVMADLGIVEASTAEILGLFGQVQTLRQDVLALVDSELVTLSTLQQALGIMRQAMTLLRGAGAANGSFPGAPGLGRDLVTWLVSEWLALHHPAARRLAGLLTLIDLREEREPTPRLVVGDVLVRGPTTLDVFELDRLSELLRDPVALLRSAYINALSNDADVAEVASKLFPRLVGLLRTLGVPTSHGFSESDAPGFGEAADFMRHVMVAYAVDPLTVDGEGAGLALAFSPASRGDLGLVATPFGSLSRETHVGGWALSLEAQTALDAFAWGRHGLTLLPRAEDGPDAAPTVSFVFEASRPEDPWTFGDAEGTRLELRGLRLRAELMLSAANQQASILAEADSAELVIAPAGTDGFVSSLLPEDGLRAKFGLGLAWSSQTGVRLRGHGSLEATLPVNVAVGGLSFDALRVGLRAVQSELDAELSASMSVSLGPVRATVQGIGLEASLSGSRPNGNLGVADLELGLKPPTGVGLSIDAQGLISGGGFLLHDPDRSQYAGVLQLSFQKPPLTLNAFGLITTRMSDGRPGYSMIILITAEDFPPIPLGLGFKLEGIGGLLGVHRTFDVEALRGAMRNDTLKSLLFPRDAIANAPAILSAISTAFPARSGSHLLGLMARITWGSPTLIRFDLALVVEAGARRRLLALGRISALLPSRENDLLRLNLNAIGVLDADAGTVAIDASLIDSRLAQRFPITGDGALRGGWGRGPEAGFLLAVGGFHPRYAPPAAVPELRRVSIALSSGDNPRLTCEAYFAITSNTLQFGARANLYAAAKGFSLQGDVGFDVLVTRRPLHFIADFRASVQLKRGSRNLFKVAVRGELEGPRPLRISGKATFEILWCDITVPFDATLVRGLPPPRPPAVDVLAQLHAALLAPVAWRGEAPAGASHGVALRHLAAGSPLVLDPLGRLSVTQDVVPLATARDLDHLSGAPLAGARRFVLSAQLNGASLAAEPLRAPFASAEYFAMDDDEKLAAPSFESFDAGATFGSAEIAFDSGQTTSATLDYEALVLDTPSAATAWTLPAEFLPLLAESGAAARSVLRTSGLERFASDTAPAVVRVEPQWTIAPVADAPPPPHNPALRTWTEHRAAVRDLNRTELRYRVVPQ